LAQKHLLFGAGSADLSVAHRQVRKHGLASSLTPMMRHLDMDSDGIILSTKTFVKTSFGQQSFSLSQYLVDSKSVAYEKGFRAALTHFASRIRAAQQPPS